MRVRVEQITDLYRREVEGELTVLGFGARRKDGGYEVEIPAVASDDGRIETELFDGNAEVVVTPLKRRSRIFRWFRRKDH